MIKKYIIAVLFVLTASFVYSQTVAVAPFIIYDQNNQRLTHNIRPEKYIYSELEKCWFEGLVHFQLLGADEYGDVYTVFDASKVCESKEKDYLIYGYVQKNEGSWFADVKLYGRSEKKIIREFFANDEKDKYERFLETLFRNISEGLGELTGLDQTAKREEELRPFELRIPCALYYWAPLNGKWQKVLTGIAGCECAVELYPVQKPLIFHEWLMDFSVQLKLSYSLGVGNKNAYELDYHSLRISAPLVSHIHINKLYTVLLGAGAYYELEMMNAVKKYEDKEFFYQSMGGVELLGGLEYWVNDLFSLKGEMDFVFQFSADGFTTIKPTLGANFNLFRSK